MLKTSFGGRSGQSGLAGLEKKLTGCDPDDSAVPAPVRKSARFMLGGALVTVLNGLFGILLVLVGPAVLIAANGGKPLTSSQRTGAIVSDVLFTVVEAAVWVWMARANRSGHTWARIAASVLFAFSTYYLYGAVNSLRAGGTITVADIVSFVLEVAQWLCGLGAIALIWRGESSTYFRARSARR